MNSRIAIGLPSDELKDSPRLAIIQMNSRVQKPDSQSIFIQYVKWQTHWIWTSQLNSVNMYKNTQWIHHPGKKLNSQRIWTSCLKLDKFSQNSPIQPPHKCGFLPAEFSHLFAAEFSYITSEGVPCGWIQHSLNSIPHYGWILCELGFRSIHCMANPSSEFSAEPFVWSLGQP